MTFYLQENDEPDPYKIVTAPRIRIRTKMSRIRFSND